MFRNYIHYTEKVFHVFYFFSSEGYYGKGMEAMGYEQEFRRRSVGEKVDCFGTRSVRLDAVNNEYLTNNSCLIRPVYLISDVHVLCCSAKAGLLRCSCAVGSRTSHARQNLNPPRL